MNNINKNIRTQYPEEMYINMRPYELVHKVKEVITTAYIDNEGYEHNWTHDVKTFCGKKLSLNKWANTKLSIDSFNCERCKKKLNV